MAIPTSKSTFKSYCLRALGFGVIDINVSDDQVDDRIDEALQYFAQYHYDGVEKMYLKYQITQDDIDRAASNDTTTATDSVDGSVTASFLEGKKRASTIFYQDKLKKVLVFSRRLGFQRNDKKGGLMAFAWFIFDVNYNAKPTIDWI